MSGIKFYSEYDMVCGFELGNIVEKIKENEIEKDWSIVDVIDFYNTLKYFRFQRFKDYIVQKTFVDINVYEKRIKKNIGVFLDKNKDNFLELYDSIDFNHKVDFFELLEEYKLYSAFDNTKFSKFLAKEDVYLYIVLKHKKVTETFDEVIKEKLVSDSHNAEIILSKFLKEEVLYLPKSLTNQDISDLLYEYISSSETNINILRKIVNFPSNNDLIINDRIKLNAKRKIKDEEQKIFRNGSGLQSGVRISYPIDQIETVITKMNGMEADISISRTWIQENLDFPTLWNNFIYIFNYVDGKMRLELDSKQSEQGVFESIMHSDVCADHLYFDSISFNFKEMLSNVELISYIRVLQIYGVRFEGMIEWFFNEYLQKEFNVNDFIVKMPSENTSYFEKCRTILPEIDRIFKQYNMLVEDGLIEQELIQMSSSSVKSKDIKSFNDKKYGYSSSEWYKSASFLLFSDQSSIFYLPDKDKQYKNFFKLILSERVKKNEFHDYQLSRMQWLFDNNIIGEDECGFLYFVDSVIIYILKELYYQEVLCFWHYSKDVKEKIDELNKHNLVSYDNSLFSKNEQDYLDYYLNKSKFTNGHDIRNRYLHGTNTNDEERYEIDYHIILKLFVIIIIKINDDLYIKEDYIDRSHK